MIDRTTNQSEAFVAELTSTYPESAAAPVTASQNIGNFQAEGRTLFAADDDSELYTTGKRARAAYRQNTTTLCDQLTPR